MEAFGLLHRQGLINPGGSRSSAMQLSDRFKAKLQVGLRSGCSGRGLWFGVMGRRLPALLSARGWNEAIHRSLPHHRPPAVFLRVRLAPLALHLSCQRHRSCTGEVARNSQPKTVTCTDARKPFGAML
jgi:hypothetical protein